MANRTKFLPYLGASSYVFARVAEVKSICSMLEDCDHGKRAFQTLPRHMQRRQVSKKPKRLPHYLREQHKREGGNNAKVTRRPSRKHRRRPRILLAEYNRRQRDHVWLETHIWHAKRFHMMKRWGYILPKSSTFKGYRAYMRAAKSSCLVQDMSYISCIELEGNISTLMAGLARIMQPSDLATVSQPKVQRGQQWETVTIFKPDVQPYGALGDVDVVWLPSSIHDDPSGIVKLWFWVHPSAHRHVIEALVCVYGLVELESACKVPSDLEDEERENGEVKNVKENDVDNSQMNLGIKESSGTPNKETDNEHSKTEESTQKRGKKRKRHSTDSDREGKRFKDVNGMKLAKRNVPFERVPKYYGSSTQVSMRLLKDTLCRFRLTGPKAINVLKAVLIPASISIPENVVDNELLEDESVDSMWWRDYYHSESKKKCHSDQVEAWEKLSGSHLRKRMVMPLLVRDPRIILPKKKTPIEPTKDSSKTVSCPTWPVLSPLYDSEVRDKAVFSKEPDSKVNKHRAQLLVPGSAIPESPDESKVPVLLLSRPHTHSLGYGMGIDVIVCSGWGMSMWVPIVLNGGVVGGQDSIENFHMELLTPLTPNLFPDTPSGDYHSATVAEERRADFFKRPPACRHNFIKLGVQFPFFSPWRKLVKDWVEGTEDIFALRNKALLQNLATRFGDAFDMVTRSKVKSDKHDNSALCGSSSQSLDMAITEGNDELQICKLTSTDASAQKLGETIGVIDVEEQLQQSNGCLVRVKLILEDRGSVEPCTMICMPQKEDFEGKIVEEGHPKASDILEPAHVDTQMEHRKKIKLEHSRIKNKIKNMKSYTKYKLEKEMNNKGIVGRGETFTKLKEMAVENLQEENKVLFAKHSSYNSEMQELWLMKKDDPLQCCSRKIMGYITHGSFSMTIGRAAGIGWVVLKPLLECLQSYKNLQLGTAPDTSAFSVLVRSPSSFNYYWAKLYVVK